MTSRHNSGAGPVGDDVTVANSGGVLGDAWESVRVTAPGASLTYDDSHGGVAIRATAREASGDQLSHARWVVDQADRVAGRIDLYLGAYPNESTLISFAELHGPQLFYPDRPDVDPRIAIFVITGAPNPADEDNPFPGTLTAYGPSGELFGSAAVGVNVPLHSWFSVVWDFDLLNDRAVVKLYSDTSAHEDHLIYSSDTEYHWRSAPAPVSKFVSIRVGSLFPFSGGAYRSPVFWFRNLIVNDTGAPAPPTPDESGDDPIPPFDPPGPGPDDDPPIWTGGDDDPYPDTFKPDAVVTADPDAGSATLLDLIREFSATVKRAVRLTGVTTIEMVDPNAPLPDGWSQADAASLYHSATRSTVAGDKALSMRAGDLALSAAASLKADDVRLVASTWRLPDQLPVYGLRPAPVQRVSYTFTPRGFSADVEYAFPAVPLVVRRS